MNVQRSTTISYIFDIFYFCLKLFIPFITIITEQIPCLKTTFSNMKFAMVKMYNKIISNSA